MNANFKTQSRLLVTGSSSDERLIIKEFINKANSGNVNFEVKPLVDINGEETGFSIELVDKEEVVEPEAPSTDSGETDLEETKPVDENTPSE